MSVVGVIQTGYSWKTAASLCNLTAFYISSYPEDGGIILLRNVGIHVEFWSVIAQATRIWIHTAIKNLRNCIKNLSHFDKFREEPGVVDVKAVEMFSSSFGIRIPTTGYTTSVHQSLSWFRYNCVHTLIYLSFKIHFNIILRSTSKTRRRLHPSDCTTKIRYRHRDINNRTASDICSFTAFLI